MTEVSRRKPHNNQAGYVCERKVQHTRGGHIVLLDRDNGGDWIDAPHRWVLSWEPGGGGGGAFVSYTSQAGARRDLYDGVARVGADVWSLLDPVEVPV